MQLRDDTCTARPPPNPHLKPLLLHVGVLILRRRRRAPQHTIWVMMLEQRKLYPVNRTFEWGAVIAPFLSVLSIVPRHCARLTYFLHPKLRS